MTVLSSIDRGRPQMNVDLHDAGNLTQALKTVGYLGCWQIDYTDQRVRANGHVGTVFGVQPEKALVGVPLDDLDRAYHADDLEHMKRARRGMIGIGGHTRIRYRLKNFETEEFTHVESLVHVTVDRDGRLKEAKGTLFNVGGLRPPMLHERSETELDQLAKHLLEAGERARRLGLSDIEAGLRPILLTVGRLIAGAALRKDRLH